MTGVVRGSCFPTLRAKAARRMGHPGSCGWRRREKAQAGPLRRRSGQVFDSLRSLRMTGVGRGSLLSHPRRSHPTDEDLSVGTPGSLPRLEWGTHFRAGGGRVKKQQQVLRPAYPTDDLRRQRGPRRAGSQDDSVWGSGEMRTTGHPSRQRQITPRWLCRGRIGGRRGGWRRIP